MLHRENEIAERLYLISNKLDNMTAFIENQFKLLDAKKIKRNRASVNRCEFFQTKKRRECMGFICKASNSLCYSHHRKSLRRENPGFGDVKQFANVQIVNGDDSDDAKTIAMLLSGLESTCEHPS